MNVLSPFSMCMCVYVNVCHVYMVPRDQKKAHMPANGVVGSGVLPYVGTENQSQRLCKSSEWVLLN